LQTKSESILGYSISFIRGVLDNPNLWPNDLPFSEGATPEETGDIEVFLEKEVFTAEWISLILKGLTTKYIILTDEEVQLWQEDSLKFFMH